MLAGNIMQPIQGEPDKCMFTMITHVNPGGVVDNPVGAKIVNALAANAPVEFVTKLEAAASQETVPVAFHNPTTGLLALSFPR